MMTRKAKCVAIWLGNFTDELDADEYLYVGFGRDFHCRPDEANVPEFCVLDSAVEIPELLKGFSFESNFFEAACAQAQKSGIATSSTAVIYYQTHYECNEPPSDSASLTFLGNFEW
jgi:hypothetical protein